jgi:hypothetical protein
MSAEASPVWTLMQTIAAGDAAKALQLLTVTPSLAAERLVVGASRKRAADFYLASIMTCGRKTGAALSRFTMQRTVLRAESTGIRRRRRKPSPTSLPPEPIPTPLVLATRQTGRGGSGGPQAEAEQADITRLLESPKVG